jgi:hypothetical protein
VRPLSPPQFRRGFGKPGGSGSDEGCSGGGCCSEFSDTFGHLLGTEGDRQDRLFFREVAANHQKADARIRTADPFITSEVLYQLSYVGVGRLSVPRSLGD